MVKEYKIDSIGRKYSATKSRTRQSLSEKFWRWVVPLDQDSCWIWGAAKDKLGYGRIGVGSIEKGDNKTFLAHRVSLMLHGFDVKDSDCVLHKCDNPSCVNPNHLIIGTKHDNNSDMAAKNRSAMGEKNGQAKLTLEEVNEIVMLSKNRSIKRVDIAKKFHIAVSTYYSIIRGLRWNKILSIKNIQN